MSKNRVIGGFEDVLERGQSTVTTAAKQTVTDFASTTKGQVTGNQNTASGQSSPADHGSNEHGASGNNQQMSDAAAQQYLKDLYGVKDQDKSGHDDYQKGSGSLSQVLGIPEKDLNSGKTPEEIARIEALKHRLRAEAHQEYYQDLVNRPKQKEETVTEKLEREDKEAEMQELATQRENPPPLNPTVKQGTAESESALSSG